MHTFQWIIGLLLGAVALSALARRIGVPYPTLLAVGGIGLAFLPIAPTITLEPDLALALFLAPVLLDAAYDTSLRDLRDNWFPVATLVLVAVAITTGAVALTARWLIPDMPWAVAVALGAIVAPPDAAAATAILRQVKLPHRLLKILEGESLLNDASALLIYRVAVGAAVMQSFTWKDFVPSIAFAIFGSLIAGYVLARVIQPITNRIEDAPSAIIVQFANTFAVWIVAEHLGLSGILTIVAFAFTVARSAPANTPARLRVPSYAVWETAVFMLNVLAFVLIGMQLRPIWERLEPATRHDYLMFAATVLAITIAIRVAWVLFYDSVLHMKIARFGFHPRRPTATPTVKGGIMVAWCGMRGIVTLAAAFALPPNFPYRDLIQLSAFVVVLGSLIIQGLTLRPLIALLGLSDDDPVTSEVRHARKIAYQAALDTVETDKSDEAELLRLEYRALLAQVKDDPETAASRELPADPLRRRALAAARESVLKLRHHGEIGDDAFHRVEEELDFAELSAQG